MVLLEFIGISLIAGTILGLVWRFTEDRWEKRNARKTHETLMGGMEEQVSIHSEDKIMINTSNNTSIDSPSPYTKTN